MDAFVLDPFCPRQEALPWIVKKSNTALCLLSDDFVRLHLVPYFGGPLHFGHWLLVDDAEVKETDRMTVIWARSGCGTAKIPWSLPIYIDGACWRFAVKMKPLGVVCLDNLLEYDAAAAVLRRRSANGGWGAPSDLQPPVSMKGRRAASVVIIDVDTLNWSFRVGLDKWISHWVPFHFPIHSFSCLRLSVVLLRNGAECTFLVPALKKAWVFESARGRNTCHHRWQSIQSIGSWMLTQNSTSTCRLVEAIIGIHWSLVKQETRQLWLRQQSWSWAVCNTLHYRVTIQ